MEHLTAHPTDKLFCEPTHIDSILAIPVVIGELELVFFSQVPIFELTESILEFVPSSNSDLTIHLMLIWIIVVNGMEEFNITSFEFNDERNAFELFDESCLFGLIKLCICKRMIDIRVSHEA
jgi:hypothetical protein